MPRMRKRREATWRRVVGRAERTRPEGFSGLKFAGSYHIMLVRVARGERQT